MITETTTTKVGGTRYLRLPPHIAKFLAVEDNVTFNIQDEQGKHGRFVSIWKKED